MQDRLKIIFETQKKINESLLNLSENEKEERTQKFVLAAIGELYELLQETNWASEWKGKKDVIKLNILQELIDTIKFILNICLVQGFDDEMFMEEFERKSLVVEQRFKQMKALEKIKLDKTKVCAIDLDGVLVKYPDNWINYINKIKKTSFKTLFDVKKNIDKEEYMSLKHQFREEGYEGNAQLYEGSKEFIDKLKSLGYSIVILTKRPYKKYFRLFADTKINLDKAEIFYDAIIFNDEKHKIIIKEFPQLEFIVEDNRSIAAEVGNWGYKCFLVNNIYNVGNAGSNVIRVDSLNEIIKIITKDKNG